MKLFRSYDPHDSHVKLIDAVYVTSAAPIFFEPIIIDNVAYIDGGVAMASNPSFQAYTEVERIWRVKKKIIIIQIGPGYTDAEAQKEADMELYRYWYAHGSDQGLWANLQLLWRSLLSIGFAVCDYDRPDMFLRVLSQHDKRLKYFRLDVPGPGKYGLDVAAEEHLLDIVQSTRKYFENEESGQEMMKQLVNELAIELK